MRHRLFGLFGLLALSLSLITHAGLLERELGDYDLRLGTSPSRSMAQGLIQPLSAGSFHGGLDLSHASGWYVGQWTPSMGITPGSNLELNTYAGYRQRRGAALGYEVGSIRYSHPGFSHLDSQEYYAGLTFAERRLGAAFSQSPGRLNSTLLADLGRIDPLGLDVILKYGHHLLDDPVTFSNGHQIALFNDWSLSVSRPWLGIDLGLFYSDSSLDGDECAAYSGHNSHCEGWFSFKASRRLF